MASKKDSVYNDSWGMKGEITITLNAEERTMICNALVNAAPKEVDIIPLMYLCDRIVKGE